MASGQQKAQQNLDAFMRWQDVHVGTTACVSNTLLDKSVLYV